jgi:DNA-binding GntR family transcriptional regulator
MPCPPRTPAAPPSTATARTMPAADSTLGTQVLAHLREQLITGLLAPGDRLSLRSVALRFSVSMQPVRDAVARLVAEHALEVTPKRSVQVPLLSAPQFRELTAIRTTIEGFAAEQAALRRGAGQRVQLRRCEAAFRRESRRPRPDIDAAIVANANLHFAVYRAAAMPALVAIIEGLWLRIGPVLNLDLREGTGRLESGIAVRCHAALVDAIERGDAPGARAALLEDIASTADFIEARGVLPPDPEAARGRLPLEGATPAARQSRIRGVRRAGSGSRLPRRAHVTLED